jgi:hypothetical protein
VTAEDRLCDEFRRLRNAGDPGADELLGRVPAVPAAAVTPEEAGRLETDYFLRTEGLRILEVRAEAAPEAAPRYRLVTKGSVAAETLTVRTPAGDQRSQRTMSNPDLVVEVRGGKLFGVLAEVNMDPPER